MCTRPNVPDGVDVQGVGTTLAELLLHGGLERAVGTDLVEPLRVDGARSAGEGEGQTRPGVVRVEHADLVGDLGITKSP